MKRTLWFSVILAGVVVLAGVWRGAESVDAAGSLSAQEAWQEPLEETQVELCCDSDPTVHVSPGRGRSPEEFRKRTPFSSDELARLKAAALSSDAVPRAEDLLDMASAPASMAALSPRLLRNFDGLNQQSGGGFFPPDTVVSVGPQHVLEATNVALRLSTRSNLNPIVQTIQAHFAISGANKVVTDPKVFYDARSERFFMMVLVIDHTTNQSFAYFAISRSPTPDTLDAPTDWCNYRVTTHRNQSWGDFPGFGMNDSWIAITTNNFTFEDSDFVRAFLVAIEKPRLVDNAARCPQAVKAFRYAFADDEDGLTPFTVQPARHYDSTGFDGDPLYLVSSQLFFSSDRYAFWQLRSGKSRKPQLRRTTVTGELYSVPPDAAQAEGGLLSTSVQDVLSVASRNGQLWATHTTGCEIGGGSNEACVRVVQFTPVAGITPAASIDYTATLRNGPDSFLFHPSVAISKRGDVVVVFQRSKASTFLGSAFTGRRFDLRQFGPVRSLREGTCRLVNNAGGGVGSSQRTGDYTGAQADPNDSRGFWLAGEHSVASCAWGTRVARVRY